MTTRPNLNIGHTSDVGLLIARAQASENDPRRHRPRPNRANRADLEQLRQLRAQWETRRRPDLETTRYA
jgi:hypothetical protein